MTTSATAEARQVSRTPRTRGAQPGNRNALRHGLYSRTFQPGELADLDQLIAADLQPEINALRIALRRLLDLSIDADSLDDAALTLDAVGKAASRIAGISRVQQMMSAEHADDLADALRVALVDITQHITITPPPIATEPAPDRGSSTTRPAKLQQALLDAFTLDDLEALLLFDLDRQLSAYAASADPCPVAVRKLITAATREGWLSDLVRACAIARPALPALQRLAQEYA